MVDRSKKVEGDVKMEVDDEMNTTEDTEGEEREADGDTELEDEMSVDEENEGEATPKKSRSKPNKLQPRKSQLDVNALNQEQAALAQYDEQEITKIRLQKKFCRDALTFIDEVESAM